MKMPTKKQIKLQELEARIEALEKRKEPEILCLRDSEWNGHTTTYAVADADCSGYMTGHDRYFPMRRIVIALARKVGLKIVYTHATGERVEFK